MRQAQRPRLLSPSRRDLGRYQLPPHLQSALARRKCQGRTELRARGALSFCSSLLNCISSCQCGDGDGLFSSPDRRVLSDFVNRVHRGTVDILAVTIPAVVYRDVFNQHASCAAPKHFRGRYDSSRALTAQGAFDISRSFFSFHSR